MGIVKITTEDKKQYEFDDTKFSRGSLKRVYFSPDQSADYVVAIYKKPLTTKEEKKLRLLVENRDQIIGPNSGFWEKRMLLPLGIFTYEGKTGFIMKKIPSNFYFPLLKGTKNIEKQISWFTSDIHEIAKGKISEMKKFEPFDILGTMNSLLNITRSVNRLHKGNLAHGDISMKNVLIDPHMRSSILIDLDNMVVPGFNETISVIGSPGVTAPELVKTAHLGLGDKGKKFPNIYSDLYSLALMIYMVLFKRHPLLSGHMHIPGDENKAEQLALGENALWVEDPYDKTNAIKKELVDVKNLPYLDTGSRPYTMYGSYLGDLFLKTFAIGLNDPKARATAADWENAIVKTMDAMIECSNILCADKYFFPNKDNQCPICGTVHAPTPKLKLYSKEKNRQYKFDDHYVSLSEGMTLHWWHYNSNQRFFPGENISLDKNLQQPLGKVKAENGKLWLYNSLENLYDITKNTYIGKGKIELYHGQKILFDSKSPDSRVGLVVF